MRLYSTNRSSLYTRTFHPFPILVIATDATTTNTAANITRVAALPTASPSPLSFFD